MKNRLTTASGATGASKVCQRAKDRPNEDPKAYKPLMRKPRQSGTGKTPGIVPAGGTSLAGTGGPQPHVSGGLQGIEERVTGTGEKGGN